jgi:TRAP-type C4-dicarboxylate transport system permease small subunit
MQVQASPEPPLGGGSTAAGLALKAARLVWRWGTETVVTLLTAVMVATILLQVFYRFVLGDPLSWSEELARYVFVWITFLGAAVAYRHGTHIVVDTIIVLLPRRVQAILGWVVDTLMVAALLTLLVEGIGIVKVNSNVEATMLEIPMSWVYASVPVSAALMLVYQVDRTLRRIRGRLGPVAAPVDGGVA